MQKIGIIGVHGAGKTSLAYILAAHFKMKGLNVKLIHESVRENCPFPINADANQGTCLWNFHKQFLNELEAEAQGYELAICDRSVLDTFVYFHAVNQKNSITESALKQAIQWLTTYEILIHLEPTDHIELLSDGVRSNDRDYQKLINQGFSDALQLYDSHDEDKIIHVTSHDIFTESKCHELVNRAETLIGVSQLGTV